MNKLVWPTHKKNWFAFYLRNFKIWKSIDIFWWLTLFSILFFFGQKKLWLNKCKLLLLCCLLFVVGGECFFYFIFIKKSFYFFPKPKCMHCFEYIFDWVRICSFFFITNFQFAFFLSSCSFFFSLVFFIAYQHPLLSFLFNVRKEWKK